MQTGKIKPTTAIFCLFLLTNLAQGGCAQVEVCDWKDNDRDGIIDEHFDADGDSWYLCGLSANHIESGDYDCDDSDAQVSPDAEEVCNGIDDNCDGSIDPGCADISFQLEDEIMSAGPWDLDVDGYQDLILFTRRQSDNRTELYQSINSGDGSFESFRLTGTDKILAEQVLLDWNKDGRVDIFGAAILGISHYSQQGNNDYVYTFHELWDIDVDGWRYYELAESHDPEPRLWVFGSTWQNPTNRVWTVYEDADGLWHLQEVGESALSGYPRALHSGDINNDDLVDLLVTDESSVALWLSNKDELPIETQNWQTEDAIADSILLDAEGDGDLDLILSIPERWLLHLFLFEDGQYQAPLQIPSYRHPGSLVSGYFNNDGQIDFAVASNEEQLLQLYFGTTDGFQVQCEYGISSSQSQLIAMHLNQATSPALQDILVIDKQAGTSYAIIDPCSEAAP